MSRSYRKPWRKDSNTNRPCTLSTKKVHRRRERRIVKQLVKPWKLKYEDHLSLYWYDLSLSDFYDFPNGQPFEIWKAASTPIEPILPTKNEIVNPYDLCDWKYNPLIAAEKWGYSESKAQECFEEAKVYSRK